MKELLPTSFVKRRANKLEAWLVELRKDSRLVSFIARARQTQKAVRSAEKLLTDLPNLRADPKILRSFDDFFVGPGILAVGPRKRVAGRRSAKPPECEHFNIDGLAALHTVAALQYGSRDAWSNVRATLQGIAAATTELHWQVHAAEDWNKLDRAAQTAALAVISRDNQELGVPPELDFLRCPWFREPVIDDLLNWADSIAHEAASFPKCMDGTYSNGAIQRVDPRVACPGDIVRLLGNFPATQDAAVAVLFPTDTGYQAAQIVSWTATMIELRLPPNATAGCIWFEDDRQRQEYRQCVREESTTAMEYVAIQRSTFLTGLPIVSAALAWWFSRQTRPEDLPCSSASSAFFAGSKIEIKNFSINSAPVVPIRSMPVPVIPIVNVWAGRPIRVGFTPVAAEHLHFCAQTADHSYGSHVELSPTDTSYVFTPNLPAGTDLRIRVFGWNRCSDETVLLAPLDASDPCTAAFDTSGVVPIVTSVEATVRVHATPQLRIIGVEATQGVQHFDVAHPGPGEGDNNIISLIRRRTTVLRVYVDSGIPGTGLAAQVLVTGSVQFAGGPTINALRNIFARPQIQIDREQTDHALTFVVPGGYLDGSWSWFTIMVKVPGEYERGFIVYQDFGFSFEPGGAFDVMGILYDNPGQGLAVTDQDLIDASNELVRMLPIADDGITLWVPASASDAHSNAHHDLRNEDGWDDLGGDLEDLAEGYEDEGERWMGIVPFSPNYALGGKAWDRNAITYPHCLSQAVREIPAHEMVHLFGIDHAPCNDTSSSLEDIDDDLRREIPNGRTEDVGFDVMGCRWRDSGCGAIPAGVGDLMSYCNSQRTWPSIALWLMLRDKIG